MGQNSLGAILEDIDGKLTGIAESVGSMNDRLTRVEKTVNEIPEMKDDIKAIKAASKIRIFK